MRPAAERRCAKSWLRALLRAMRRLLAEISGRKGCNCLGSLERRLEGFRGLKRHETI